MVLASTEPSHIHDLSGKVVETHTTMKIGNKNKEKKSEICLSAYKCEFEFAMCGHTIVTMITIYEIVNVSIACVLLPPRLQRKQCLPNTQTNVHQMELNIDE